MEITESAESNPHQCDVFVNHRGPDVKKTFAAHLHNYLVKAGLRPFLDNDIWPGSHVLNSIDDALKGARIPVAIFSKGYAESEHCLSELCDMLESGKEILPVFYHVEPEHLRRIEGGPFDDGFRKHIERGKGEQIEKWRDALFKTSYIRGFRLDEVNGNEVHLIENIIDKLVKLLDKHPPSPPGVQTGDRRLNVLVLGDPESVKAVISHVCGAQNLHTPVKDCPKLTENMNSWPPICLYGDMTEIYKKDFKVIKTFVTRRNKDWNRTKVQALWADELDHNNPKKWTELSRELRLHMLWFVCKVDSNLPDHFEWSKITKLYELPVQILVVHDLRIGQGADFNTIFKLRSKWFPKAQTELEELIVEVALQDKDIKKKLWHKCWGAKTRAEICNVAKIIRYIRKQLGSEGKSFSVGVGSGGIITKEVSLRRSGEFVLNFLSTYWNIPQDSILRVLTETTFKQRLAKRINIKPSEFVKFCLTVAAIILDDARDNAGEPKYVTSGSSFGQFWQTKRYFDSSRSQYCYDKMKFENIRGFLQSIFERKDSMSHVPSVDKTNVKWSSALLLNGWRARTSHGSCVSSFSIGAVQTKL